MQTMSSISLKGAFLRLFCHFYVPISVVERVIYYGLEGHIFGGLLSVNFSTLLRRLSLGLSLILGLIEIEKMNRHFRVSSKRRVLECV